MGACHVDHDLAEVVHGLTRVTQAWRRAVHGYERVLDYYLRGGGITTQ